MIKYFLFQTVGGKGFITAEDQTVNGLAFKHTPVEAGKAIVEIEGTEEAITAWNNRVKGAEINANEKDAHFKASEKASLQREIAEMEPEIAKKKARLATLNAAHV